MSAMNFTGRKKSDLGEITQIKLSNHQTKPYTVSKSCTKLQSQVFSSVKFSQRLYGKAVFQKANNSFSIAANSHLGPDSGHN